MPIKLTFHFKISWLASYFTVQRSPERKREKTFTWQWRNSTWVISYEFFSLCFGQFYQTNGINFARCFSSLCFRQFYQTNGINFARCFSSLCFGQFYQTNGINFARCFSNNFLIQIVYLKSFWWKQFYLLLFIYIGAVRMFDLYIMNIFFGAKVNHTSLKNAG